MKKRLLSALLALALVFVLLPTTALAGVTTESNYDISIDGKRYKFDSDGSGGYTTAYYQENNGKTPTSNYEDVWQTNPYLEITRVDNIITITVKIGSKGPGKSVTIGASTQDINYECIAVNGAIDLIITGDTGTSLTLNKTYCGAALSATKGNITITDGVKVTASFKNKAVGNYVFYAIWAKNLTVSGANTEVTASGNCEDAIHVSGTVTVSKGAKLTATNDHNDRYKPYPITKSSAIKSDVLTIADENSCVIAQAIDSSYGKPLRIQNYNIAGATIKAGSSNYNSTETTIDKIDGNTYVKISVPALTKTSDVLIAGKDAVVGVETSIPSANGSGTYFYDQASKTLTLKDVNIASSSIINGIQFTKDGTYTINLVGTNTMSGFSTGISANSADQYVSNINITITGAGSLEVSTTSYAIAMNKGNLKFENTGEIKLTTSNPSKNRNVLSVSGNITITDMDKYSVTGITQTGNLNVTGDTVTLSEASHLKGYQNPDGTAICLKTITITPTPAKDSTISYGNKTLKQGEIIKGEISGTATVATKGNTITLNNFNGTQALSFEATLADSTLVLEGTNTLSSIVTTQKGLTISVSGSGSLTVGSIRVPNNTQHTANLTINGATVTVGTAELNARAIDVNGSLTVTGASLTATSASDSVPTVQVGGNASFTGSTVTITNNSTTQGKSGKNSYEVSTGLYVGGTLDIKNAAKVTSTVTGGNAIYAKGDITISGDSTEVNAQNSAYKFSAISTNKTVNISDNSTVKAENLKRHQGDPTGETDPSTGKTYNACPAITGKIANKNTQNKLHIAGFTTSSAGSQNPTEGTPLYLDIAPGSVEPYIHHYKVTITRGDEVTRTNSPVVIAGTPLLNDTYYTITNGSKVAEGTDSNYNAIYDSANKTLKLNNAQISTTTKNAAIKISEDLTITVTGTNELKGNYNHCIESYNNFTINGTGTLNMTNTNSSSRAASVIYCGPYKNLTIAAEVIIKNEAQPGNLIFTVEKDAYSFAKGYNVYASTDVSGSPLETYDAAKSSTYQYLRITKENLAPTTPTTYTVTITAGDNMKCESGALTQEVTKGAAITEVKFVAASGHYFPADYVSKMNLPAGLTAEIRENSWYLIISGTPTSDVTINLPAASVRPTITVSMPTPAAGNTPATANDITLTYSDINKSISKNLTISNVVWQSYVSNGDGSITLGEILSNGDKFVEGTKYRVTINFEGVSEDYAIVPAAGTTAWSNAEWGPRTMTLHFDVTGAACTHEYTNDWHANGNTHWHECKLCRAHADEVAHTFGDWITDTPATDTTDGSKHRTCSVCQYQENATIPKTGTGEIVPPTPDNPGTIVIIRPAEEEKPAQQPNPSTGANDLVGLAVAAAVAAALGSAALLRKHD